MFHLGSGTEIGIKPRNMHFLFYFSHGIKYFIISNISKILVFRDERQNPDKSL